jgi:toxin secretion/phage lysis holin
MKELWNTLQLALAAVGAWLGWFHGGMDGLIYAVIVFVIAAYITGVMCAINDKRLSSEIGFKGICRKIIIFMLIGVANLIDVYVIKSGAMLRTATIFFYLSNEGISLLENAVHLGLPVPEKIKQALKQLADNNNKKEK